MASTLLTKLWVPTTDDTRVEQPQANQVGNGIMPIWVYTLGHELSLKSPMHDKSIPCACAC